MGHFLRFARMNLFSKASFLVLAISTVSFVREVAESLRMSGSSRLISNENQVLSRHSVFDKLNADVRSDASARRDHFAPRTPVCSFAANLSSAFLLVNPLVSRTEEGRLKEPPALSVVDVGLFEVINPLPENEAKILDLSWLAQVVLEKEEAENLPGTKPSPLINEADINSGANVSTDVGERSTDKGKSSRVLPPEGEKSGEDVTGNTLPPKQSQEDHNIRNKGMDSNGELDSRRAALEGGGGRPSSGSLADAIQATGDKDLIEKAGLDAKNPWKLIDDADAVDRERDRRMAEGRRRDHLPEGGDSGGARQGGGVPGAKEKDEVPQELPQLPTEADSGKNEPAGGVFIGKAIRVDATYIFEKTAGPLNVPFGPDAPKLCRTVLVENTSSEPVRIFARTTGATFIPENVSTHPKSRLDAHSSTSSFLENSAHFLKHTFLQVSSLLTAPPESSPRAEEKNMTLTPVDELLEHFRQSREDRPGKPCDLLINLLEGGLVSDSTTTDQLDTEEAVKRVEDLRQLMEKIFGQRKQAVQVMKTLQMIIVSFPYCDEYEVKVKEVLEFIRQSFDGLMSHWSFAGEVAVTSGTFSDPPSTTDPADTSKSPENEDAEEKTRFMGSLPEDPELQRKLYGLFMTNISSAWMHGENGEGAVVAILDTGVSRHADLECNFWTNLKETENGSDTDGNGLPDDVRGYNFDEERGDPEDHNGHGTHVAGTVGACANRLGVVGGSFGAKMISLRFMDKDGSGAVANGIRGVAYAIEEGAHILNNSWGGSEEDPQLARVLDLTRKAHGGKGILIVNAAGNDSVDNDLIPSYPANWKNENSVSVAAVDKDGKLADFSNWGRETVDIAAPGVTIYSTAPMGEFQFMSGTSMATPHVSAVAALVYGAFLKNGYHPAAYEVKDILRLTVKQIPSLKDLVAWGGIPNAKDAILMARMGGMWAQCACEDMIIDVLPGTARTIKIFFNGYRRGTYRAYLTLDVFNEQQSRVEKIKIPFTIVSSQQPAQNKHTDSEVAGAFSKVSNLRAPFEEEETEDLCRLQVKFLELGAGLPLWAIILLAAVGTVLMLALVVGYVTWQKRRERCSSRHFPDEEAFLPRKDGNLQVDDDAATDIGIASSLSRRGRPSRRKEPEILDVPRELHSREDAYR